MSQIQCDWSMTCHPPVTQPLCKEYPVTNLAECRCKLFTKSKNPYILVIASHDIKSCVTLLCSGHKSTKFMLQKASNKHRPLIRGIRHWMDDNMNILTGSKYLPSPQEVLKLIFYMLGIYLNEVQLKCVKTDLMHGQRNYVCGLENIILYLICT